ncbi:hypothetical protein BV20DRAFT_314622 [Pilatotrama ljubarskyi]|nr:hypothetical protein BV20DRAFT_314622 [Pilatotrama ljubarskyi]
MSGNYEQQMQPGPLSGLGTALYAADVAGGRRPSSQNTSCCPLTDMTTSVHTDLICLYGHIVCSTTAPLEMNTRPDKYCAHVRRDHSAATTGISAQLAITLPCELATDGNRYLCCRRCWRSALVPRYPRATHRHVIHPVRSLLPACRRVRSAPNRFHMQFVPAPIVAPHAAPSVERTAPFRLRECARFWPP